MLRADENFMVIICVKEFSQSGSNGFSSSSNYCIVPTAIVAILCAASDFGVASKRCCSADMAKEITPKQKR